MQGASLGGIQASSFVSCLYIYFVVCLELLHMLSLQVAGVNIGLAVSYAKRENATSRWKAF